MLTSIGSFAQFAAVAPLLRDVALEVADKYAKRFRNGSHWKIADEEYETLAKAIEAAGAPYPGPQSDPG